MWANFFFAWDRNVWTVVRLSFANAIQPFVHIITFFFAEVLWKLILKVNSQLERRIVMRHSVMLCIVKITRNLVHIKRIKGAALRENMAVGQLILAYLFILTCELCYIC